MLHAGVQLAGLLTFTYYLLADIKLLYLRPHTRALNSTLASSAHGEDNIISGHFGDPAQPPL